MDSTQLNSADFEIIRKGEDWKQMLSTKGWAAVVRFFEGEYDKATELRESITPGSAEDWKLLGKINALKELASRIDIDIKAGKRLQQKLNDRLTNKTEKKDV